MGIAMIVLATVAGVLAFIALHFFQQARALRKQYSKIIDLDNELAARRKVFEQALDADRRRVNDAILQQENALKQQQADIEAQRRAAETEVMCNAPQFSPS